jgi:hypothetical protein
MFTILVLALGSVVCSANAAPVGTAFMYQGRLIDDNIAAEGFYDFRFELYDDPNAGTQQGPTVDINDVNAVDGYFTVELDFGSDVFTGDARWLEIAVRPTDSNDPNYTPLDPRQEVTPTPYALYAKTAGETTALPTGVIVMWSGSIATIPTGWALCDGTNDTPDLRDRFIIGACGKAAVGSKGERHGGLFGSDNDLYIKTNLHPGGWTGAPSGSEMCGEHSHDLMPPYYALAFIMKL